jgi:ABC-type ATPase with predicted acetyltransferase domain
MADYSVSRRFEWHGFVSEKVAGVMRMFGLSVDRMCDRAVEHCCKVRISPGDVVYITGPSGAGKSVLLRELEKEFCAEERINLDEIELVDDRAVIDCFEAELLDVLGVLSSAGLSDAFCFLNEPALLSEGEQSRFRLAKALASGKKVIFADEFCSNLDRISASVICYNVQKFAKRHGVTFILASSQDDVVLDLSPDVLVVKELCGEAKVTYKERRS